MLTFDFTTDDLARTRFAVSPMWETVSGLRWLSSPDRVGPHLPWLKEVMPAAVEMKQELALMLAMLPNRGYIPDFLTPPPESPVESFDEELRRLRRTKPAVVRHDLERLDARRRAKIGDALEKPARARDEIADGIEMWFERSVQPHWPRVRSVLDADLAYRAKRLTEGGPAMLFADLDRETSWHGDRLVVNMDWEGREALAGRGLVIVPSVFGWHRAMAMAGDGWQPTLLYPARGVELVWEPGEPAPEALAGVIGRSRADLLTQLEAPRSTTELARLLDLSPGGASQHLSALKAAGLVSATRQGREVLYLRTDLADRLLAGPGT